MSGTTRQYDVVLFGATGYTGKLTAAYMATNIPSNTKWAIAGRSASKLESVAATCKSLNPDRIQPAIEVCNLDDAELGDLARKTTIFLTTVGPYTTYGEVAFKACAENGTHYLDCTGEAPWVWKMIQKYEKVAQTTGAIMIPQIGIESAPPDLLTWSLVSLIRNKVSAPTAHVLLSVHELITSVSGGSALTALTMPSQFSFSELAMANKPFGLSPIPAPKSKTSASWFTRIVGVRTVPYLGLLTVGSIQGVSDVPIVQRSWGILGGAKLYGPNFFYEQYSGARTYFQGIAMHLAVNLGGLLLLFPPFRWLVRKLVAAPGEGPSEEGTKGNRAEYRAIAIPDVATSNPPTAYGRACFEGGIYYVTGLLMTQAAITLLKDDVVAKKFGGGILTPATLGQPFIDRLHNAGFTFETKMIDS